MKTPIGIFAGTFDPVHEGHESLARQAVDAVGLVKLYIVPEQQPRRKEAVTPYKHRIAMLREVFGDKDSPFFVYEQAEPQSSVTALARDNELNQATHLVLGSDVAFGLKTWPNVNDLLEKMHFVVGVRNHDDAKRIHTLFAHLGRMPGEYTLLYTDTMNLTSSQARLQQSSFHPKIQNYIKKHHLYKV